MAYPPAPQPAQPPPPPAASSSLDIGALITAGGAVLTFLGSFVRIYKVEAFGQDTGWSVWTREFAPGLFGVGTWIPFFALVAGALALARAFAGLGDKEIAGFSVIQLQLVAVFIAVIQWLGYLVSIVSSDSGGFGAADVKLGGGMAILFVGLAIVTAGTVVSLLGGSSSVGAGGAPGPGGWPAPTPPPPPVPQWQQPPPPAAPAPGQWQPPAAPAPEPGAPPPPPPPPPGQPGQPGWDPQATVAPGQWQPDPAAPPSWTPPPGPEQAWSPPTASDPGGPAPAPAPPGPAPEPGPLDPQPAPPIDPGPGPGPGGGALIDPGTQVIPGPPPAPPGDDPGHVGGGPDALPPIPPSNTP